MPLTINYTNLDAGLVAENVWGLSYGLGERAEYDVLGLLDLDNERLVLSDLWSYVLNGTPFDVLSYDFEIKISDEVIGNFLFSRINTGVDSDGNAFCLDLARPLTLENMAGFHTWAFVDVVHRELVSPSDVDKILYL